MTDIATGNTGCCAPGNGFGAAAVPQQKPSTKGYEAGSERIHSVSQGGSVTKGLEQGTGFTRGILLLRVSAKAWDGDGGEAGREWDVSDRGNTLFQKAQL